MNLTRYFIAAASAAVFLCAQASAQTVTQGQFECKVGKGTGKVVLSAHDEAPACHAACAAKFAEWSCIRHDRGVAGAAAPDPIPEPHPEPAPPPAPGPTPEPLGTWRKLADDGKGFLWASPFTARYGAPGQYVVQEFEPGNYVCNAATFGTDPAPGAVKTCERLVLPSAVDPPPVVVEPPPPVTLGSIKLSWNRVTTSDTGQPLLPGDITGYRISYGTSPGNYTAAIEISDDKLVHEIKDLPPATYYVVVTAIALWGTESAPSAEAIKVIPG